MSTFRWWHILFNLNFIAFVAITIAVIYCLWTGQGFIKNQKFPFVGLKNFPRFQRRKRKRRFNKSEERCREIFQSIFNRSFKSVRPDWLKNPATGKNLELDGYSPSIKTKIGRGLAFEYDGEQHSKYNRYFHSSPKEFIYQTKKDAWKDLQCKRKGVLLIRIPHFVAYEDLERYIKNRLRQEGLKREFLR